MQYIYKLTRHAKYHTLFYSICQLTKHLQMLWRKSTSILRTLFAILISNRARMPLSCWRCGSSNRRLLLARWSVHLGCFSLHLFAVTPPLAPRGAVARTRAWTLQAGSPAWRLLSLSLSLQRRPACHLRARVHNDTISVSSLLLSHRPSMSMIPGRSVTSTWLTGSLTILRVKSPRCICDSRWRVGMAAARTKRRATNGRPFCSPSGGLINLCKISCLGSQKRHTCRIIIPHSVLTINTIQSACKYLSRPNLLRILLCHWLLQGGGGGVCCSVAQYVATCCNLLQCVVMCCSVLLALPNSGGFEIHCSTVLQFDAVCCSVLQPGTRMAASCNV